MSAVLFRQVRAEWTKLRTVRRWTLTLLAAAVAMVVMTLLGVSGASVHHVGGPEDQPPIGPEGKRVSDAFQFVHRELRGDGTVTARVASLKSRLDSEAPGAPKTVPWAKAGIMVKAGARPGASYVALLVTPGHGVRLQYDFLHDRQVASSTKWLRLTRAGSAFTAYVSDDGTTWKKAGTVKPRSVPETARAGVFTGSPAYTEMQRSFGGLSVSDSPAHAVGVFDHMNVTGTGSGPWTDTKIGDTLLGWPPGARGTAPTVDGATLAADTATVTGSGEIGPLPRGSDLVQSALQGALVGLLVVVAVGALSMTSEFRHGLVRTTFTAQPRRGGVLVAKALVLGVTVFAVSSVALAVVFPMAQSRLRSSGFRPPGFHRWSLSDPVALRAVIGSALLVALVAVLAMAFGAVFRHSAAAIAVVLVVILVPQLLAPGLPLGAARFLLSVTPAAGFAIQQSEPHYSFASDLCVPDDGCYPLSPWAGLAVPCLYVVAAMALAWWRLRRRDA